MLNALVTSTWTDNLREIREDVRRVLVFVLLTVSGVWRALALALDGLARGLDGEWRRAADRTGIDTWWPFRMALRAVAWLPRIAASAAGALSRLSAAHLRLAANIDERLLRVLGETAAPA
ncbi:MAG: hypothetical protein F4X76_09440 [Chloroflexi bacterium]|nr:hypothetical protein [Chloroflexota bacterium]